MSSIAAEGAAVELPAERRRSILGDLREIIREVSGSRELVLQLTLRDIRVRYKQAVFGFAWAIVVPTIIVLVGLGVRFAFAQSAGRRFLSQDMASMAVKAVPWGFFVGCISGSTMSLLGSIQLVTKIYFPREVLPLSTVVGQTWDSLISGSVILIALMFFKVTLSIQMLWAPLLLALLWCLALASALFLSCANIFFRDVKYIVQIFLSFGIFVTPVILDAPAYGHVGSQWMMLNPVAPLLEGLRLSVVNHHNLLHELYVQSTVRGYPGFLFWRPWYLAYSATWAIGGLLFSAILFHRSERRFAEIA